METERAARQVINNKITTDRFFRDYTAEDAIAVFGPPVMLLTLARLISGRFGLPDMMGLAYGISIFVFLAWGTIIYVLPSWQSPMDFAKYTWNGIMTPDEYEHIEHHYKTDREQQHETQAKWWHTETRTQDLHRVDQFPIGTNVVRLLDGRLVGGLEVSSSNMALADSTKWQQNVDTFEDFLENSLDFDFTIHSPTRRFKKAQYVTRQRDRLQDDDVRENLVLEQTCADYADWLDAKLGGNQTSTRRTFILVPVAPHEVRHIEDEETVGKNLADIPLFGRLFARFDDEVDMTEAELYERQLEEVDRRIDSIQNNCIADLSGCSSTVATDGDLAELVYSFWEGEEFEGDMGDLLRRYPLITTDDTQRDTIKSDTETTA